MAIAVDDAQWADAPSLRFAVYLARRVSELPVALMLAARSPDPSAPEPLLAELADGRPVLELAPLSDDAIAGLISDALEARWRPRSRSRSARRREGTRS